MRRGPTPILAAALAALAACGSRRTTPSPVTASHWVAAWQAPPQLAEPRNLPPAPGLAGSTLRQTIRVSLGGTRWRFRVSNEFGDGPLTLSAMHVAHGAAGRDSIDAAGDLPVTFGGQRAITIAPGAAALSDVVTLRADPFTDLAVSMHVTAAPAGVTGHPGSRTTSYLLAGDHVAERTLPGASRAEHWYLLSRLDVTASSGAAAVVVLGNSIADGRGSGTDKNDRWPDDLARRLRANPATQSVSVLNAGIGGNAVLRGGLGPTAPQRFERDVLDQPGVRWLIVSEGVNDIGGARPDSAASVARQLIAAYTDMIARAHARGLRVYGATILPFGTSFYASPEHEWVRQTVNRWVRTGRQFDAVIDFDSAMADPADSSRLRPDVDSGDHLHPNENGYRVMAGVIDLAHFEPRQALDQTPRSGNPILAGWYADPEAHVFDDHYWIYPTYSAPYDQQTFMDAFSSRDLITWDKHPRVLDVRDVSWARRALWAPSIIQKDGWYYLFFGANDIQNDQQLGGIGVARSRTPQGPFKDYLGKPLIDKFHNGAQPIDQMVFKDRDGSYYIVYGGWRHCNIAKLNAAFTALVPFPDGSTFKEITPAGYVEGAFMLVKEGKYYFMWSEGGWTGPNYAVAYAVGSSPLGPFERVGKILQQDSSVATGAGHHSVIQSPASGKWYIVYHRRPLGETDRNHRVVSIDELHFDEHGRIQPVKITTAGVPADPLREIERSKPF